MRRPGFKKQFFVDVDASDNSALALDVARGNADKHGARVTFHQSDWFAALQGRRWHLIVSNPPYIAADDPHLAGLSAEPESALVAAERGIAALAIQLLGYVPGVCNPTRFFLNEAFAQLIGRCHAPGTHRTFDQINSWLIDE